MGGLCAKQDAEITISHFGIYSHYTVSSGFCCTEIQFEQNSV
jgi:hypothetical protein